MIDFSRRTFLASAFAVTACTPQFGSRSATAETFICPPCGCSMDDTEFDAPGICPDCGMTLAPKIEQRLGFEPTRLLSRAGYFKLAGGIGHETDHIQIHYYMPDGFTADSDILLIIPGAGRNSAEYRNVWLDTARRENILIAALGYPEETYDFAAYHMGGIIKNFEFKGTPSVTEHERSTVIQLVDDNVGFEINPDSETWLFNDFDRIFEFLVSASGSNAPGYDVFGHSAGGQILHRFALLNSSSKANHIIAANAGFYTLPLLDVPPLSGLDGTGITTNNLINTFATNMTLLLGEADNNDQAGGTLLHTPLIDQQGMGRLDRGHNFYQTAQMQAQSLNAPLHWKIKTVPDIGHDFEAMSRAAAELLYP